MNEFFTELTQGGHSRHFELKNGDALLSLLRKQTIKASSSETENDLELILEDNQTRIQNPAVGFSIKSQLGSASTLLNSSGATNFIYRVVRNGKASTNGFPVFEHGKHASSNCVRAARRRSNLCNASPARICRSRYEARSVIAHIYLPV